MATDDKDRELAKKQWERYEYMRESGHTEYVKNAKENEMFYQGGDGQWDQDAIRILDAEGRPHETINKIKQKVNAVVNYQLSNRAETTFKPRDNVSDPQIATLLTKLSMQIDDHNRVHWLETDILEDGCIRSRGYLDARIDQTIDPRGDIVITKKNPNNIMLDPDASSYYPHEWKDFIETKWMSLEDIEALYGKRKAKKLEGRQITDSQGIDSIDSGFESFGTHSRQPNQFLDGMSREPMYLGNASLRDKPLIRVLSRQYRRVTAGFIFADPATGDTSPVPNSWDEDRMFAVAQKHDLIVIKRPMIKIRWSVTADNVVLFDDWSPYRTFTIVPFFPYFRWGRTMGIVDDLKSPQRILNKSASQELHILNSVANSGWMVEEDSLVNLDEDELEEYGAKSGLIMVFKRGSEKPEKIQPNQLPSGLDIMAQRGMLYLDDVSNVPKAFVGTSREDVSGRAIKENKESGGFNLGRIIDNLARTRHILALKKLELVQDFYTQHRIIRVVGANKLKPNDVEDLEVNAPDPATGELLNNLSAGEYDVVITTTPDRDTFQDAQFEEAIRLRELGVNIPDSAIIASSHLEQKQDLVASLENDQTAQQLKQLEIQKTEAEVKDKLASAEKRMAEARKTLMEAEELRAQLESGTDPQLLEHEREMTKIELENERQSRKLRFDNMLALQQAAAKQNSSTKE